ncbi:hypothetical protein IQ07DRAFT_590667 [Pyrenochaeta sp. DS3sAY3a]|nr:hypothetical protein IQ07DRAFT_590667 [Pyrenochaeta sp. DS3sAY3a]
MYLPPLGHHIPNQCMHRSSRHRKSTYIATYLLCTPYTLTANHPLRPNPSQVPSPKTSTSINPPPFQNPPSHSPNLPFQY